MTSGNARKSHRQTGEKGKSHSEGQRQQQQQQQQPEGLDSKNPPIHPDDGSAATGVTTTTSSSNRKKPESSMFQFFSVSCAASVLMALYLVVAAYNLCQLMFPLSMIDIRHVPRHEFVHPLWKTTNIARASSGGDDDEDNDFERHKLYMRVYLSTRQSFQLGFLESEFQVNSSSSLSSKESDVALLLWEEQLNHSHFSKSILLTTLSNCDENDKGLMKNQQNSTCLSDSSYRFASDWLKQADHAALEALEGGLLSTMTAAAGQGIESTSILLTVYQSIATRIRSLFDKVSLVQKSSESVTATKKKKQSGLLGRTTITLSPSSAIWSTLVSNSTVFVHVLVLRKEGLLLQQQQRQEHETPSRNQIPWPPKTLRQAQIAIQTAAQTNSLLLGHVNMIKYELPHHIGKAGRILYHDVIYLFRKYLLRQQFDHAPWDMEYSKPVEYTRYQTMLKQKEAGITSPYWKPEVSIKYVNDEQSYPADLVHLSGMPMVRVQPGTPQHPTGYAFMPALHVDEIGLTSEKYIPINQTVTSLPLRISFDRNDMKKSDADDEPLARATGTAGGISPARWRLLSHLSKAIDSQKQLGFDQSDIDDVRRLIADTNVTLLGITLLSSALHLLFEFLTFKSEVTFWSQNKDLTGLSVRSLVLDMISQVIILLFLVEKDSSLLMTIPSAIGCFIALWKCHRAFGFQLVRVTHPENKTNIPWWNQLPRMVGYELHATRLEQIHQKQQEKQKSEASKTDGDGPRLKNGDTKDNVTLLSSSASLPPASRLDLAAVTLESDRIATRTLGVVLLPLVLLYSLYSLIREEHVSWYSWIITTASSAVYALGFVLMTPQLFLNWKLKSVAHLPWRVLVYKSLNTFIDDLFSFIIRMPTMARISCFRDDVVFFIYLYQRWLYPVDQSRPVEGVGEGGHDPGTTPETTPTEKKNQ